MEGARHLATAVEDTGGDRAMKSIGNTRSGQWWRCRRSSRNGNAPDMRRDERERVEHRLGRVGQRHSGRGVDADTDCRGWLPDLEVDRLPSGEVNRPRGDGARRRLPHPRRGGDRGTGDLCRRVEADECRSSRSAIAGRGDRGAAAGGRLGGGVMRAGGRGAVPRPALAAESAAGRG